MKIETIATSKGKLCKVIRLQKKPYLGVLKSHKQFRIIESKQK